MKKLKQIFKTNWKTIVFSYSLFSINAILMLVYPKVLGNTIDHLITKDYNYIWYLVVTFISLMFFSYVSRIYDVKKYISLYTNDRIGHDKTRQDETKKDKTR